MNRLLKFLAQKKSFKISFWESPRDHFRLLNMKTVFCRLEADGICVIGSARHESIDQAFIISAVEAFERWCQIHFLIPSSNGCASGVTLPMTKSGARMELLERDAFFCHFLSGVEPRAAQMFGENEILIRPQEFKHHDLSVRCFELYTANKKLFTSLIVVQNKAKTKLTLGTSTKKTAQLAQRSALLEAMDSMESLLRNPTPPTILDKLQNKMHRHELITPENHLQLCADAKAIKIFNKSFFPARKIIYKNNFPSPRIRYENYDLKKTFLKKSGIFFVRAHSEDLQSPFWGLPKPLWVNSKRLHNFATNFDERLIPWNTFHLFA